MRDSFRFIFESVWSNRRRAVLTVAMIAIGISSLVGIQTAVEILSEKVAGTFERGGAGRFTLQPKEDSPPLTLHQAAGFKEMMCGDASSGVTVWGVLHAAAVARGGGRVTDPVVRLVAADEAYTGVYDIGLSAGRNFSVREVERREAVALIGDNVRRKLFGEDSAVGREISLAGDRFTVVGVLDRQGALFGAGTDGSVLCPPGSSSITSEGYKVTVRYSALSRGSTVAEAGRRMAAVRRLTPGAEPDFETVQSDSTQELFDGIRRRLSLVALAVGLITMLGASVGLMNSMLVSVKERWREIGIRRALGARARAVERQFLLESLLIGQMGNVAGVALGLLLGSLVALALDGRFVVPWLWIAAATALSAAVSLASGLLPARRAAALDPVEALRSL
ncbi:MAG: ABC transporter permease [Bacteroidales bacterium]|nr:ABC transporter permease [Bacteroidales bacterium]